MCFGGGGGSSPAAETAAREREEEERRLAEIDRVKQSINAVFDDPRRAAQYREAAGGVEDLNRFDLDRQREDEARGLRFNLARAGLAGGSADVDVHGRLEDQYAQGLARAAELGSETASRLRADDERTRGTLLREAEGGLSYDDAISRALAGMEANAETNLAGSRVAALGDTFTNVADSLVSGAVRRGEQAAIEDWRRRNEAALAGLAPQSGASGRVTSIG